jgi:hypothetical protein
VGSRLGLLRRLTADVHTLVADELQGDVAECCAVPLDALHRGDLATVTGRVRSVVYNPKETVQTFTAELFDGSAAIDVVWLGRRRIAGIEPGRKILVRGRVGEHEGRPAIYNPIYELRCAS